MHEELGHIGRVGCALCLLGSLIIVLHAPEDKEITTVDEILHYAIQPGMLGPRYSIVCLSQNDPLRFSLVLLYGARLRAWHDLLCIAALRCSKPTSIHLHLFPSRFHIGHGYQRVRRGSQINSCRKKSVDAPEHLRLRHRCRSLHPRANELL